MSRPWGKSSKTIKSPFQHFTFMQFKFSKGRIALSKELSELDRLVLRFVRILDRLEIGYAIISGYIAILFGRSRNTEDVDLFIEEMRFEKFALFWNELEKEGLECINAGSPESAYNDYLKEMLSIRFAVKGTFLPNFELKFPQTKYNRYSLEHRIEVVINKEKLITSEIELQIAFKLKLGSDKDFEDARHLYNIFKESLNRQLLKKQISGLGVEKQARQILWKKA